MSCQGVLDRRKLCEQCLVESKLLRWFLSTNDVSCKEFSLVFAISFEPREWWDLYLDASLYSKPWSSSQGGLPKRSELICQHAEVKIKNNLTCGTPKPFEYG